MDTWWTQPFTCMVAGPTGCGKTEWVKRFITHLQDMVTPVPTKIIWSYGEWQPSYHPLQDRVQFVQGLPDLPAYSREPLLLVIDDQMQSVDQRVCRFFTKESHHHNISVIYIVQNLFDKHKEHPTISLNAHYLVVFKNPRDGSQILHLAKQMYPGKPIMFVKPSSWPLDIPMDTSWWTWNKQHQRSCDSEVTYFLGSITRCMYQINSQFESSSLQSSGSHHATLSTLLSSFRKARILP